LHGTGTEILYIYDPAGNENKGQGRVSYQTVTGTDLPPKSAHLFIQRPHA
jgi:hypothetical protein